GGNRIKSRTEGRESANREPSRFRFLGNRYVDDSPRGLVAVEELQPRRRPHLCLHPARLSVNNLMDQHFPPNLHLPAVIPAKAAIVCTPLWRTISRPSAVRPPLAREAGRGRGPLRSNGRVRGVPVISFFAVP